MDETDLIFSGGFSMKTLKRISALLLALLLVTSFSITAFAEDNQTNIPGENDESFDFNYAIIGTNNGTVANNMGDIIVNASKSDAHPDGALWLKIEKMV